MKARPLTRSMMTITLVVLVHSAPVRAASPSMPTALQVGGFPGGRIHLGWTDNSADETYFRIERSVGDRTNYAYLTTVPANATEYDDTAVAPDTTYWYRVQACNAEECSAHSKQSYNVSFAAGSVPNLDERYMLFLANESRADPAAYGHPSYSPVPPVAYNALLNYAAHSHSQAILNSDFTIGHCYPDDPDHPDIVFRCPSERARDVGYQGGVSENLIAGWDGWKAAASAHQAFMDSEGHRNNILDPGAKEAGMGHVYDPSQGNSWPGQYTYTFCGWNPVSLSALPSGIVVPYWGRKSTDFTFLVNFYNEGGTGPTQAHVVIDGTAHTMSLRHGTASNGSYAYETSLPAGHHTYHFEFHYGSDQSARLPVSGDYTGPDVEVGAAVLEVPGEFATLAEALAHAKGDVTVQLAAGTFKEVTPIGVPEPGVWIQGAGVDETIIQGDGSGHVLAANVDALIRDLTVTGSGTGYFESGLWNTSGHVEVRNCRFTGNNVGIFTWCFSPDCNAVVTVRNAIFDHNARVAVDANEHGVHRLINNTVVANERGVVLNNAASLIENSIVVNNAGDGLAGSPSATSRYNDVWGNGRNYSGVDVGTGDISVDPRFMDEGPDDYWLQVGSPCRDAGDPASQYNDPDGSRNDMGAYGGPHAIMALASWASSPRLAEGAFTVSWQGYATVGIESYDVQYRVNDTGLWTDWLIHTTSTSAEFGPLAPVGLLPGTSYYFRSRALDSLSHVEEWPRGADTQTTVVSLVHSVHLPIVARDR